MQMAKEYVKKIKNKHKKSKTKNPLKQFQDKMPFWNDSHLIYNVFVFTAAAE